MWVLSQDKRILMNCQRFNVCDNNGELPSDIWDKFEIIGLDVNGHITSLGYYSTEEKALHVIDRIEKAIIHEEKMVWFGPDSWSNPDDEISVFKMPQDNEVW